MSAVQREKRGFGRKKKIFSLGRGKVAPGKLIIHEMK